MEDTKKCGRCQLEKLFIDFNKCKGQKSGLHSHCRSCQKDVKKEWYLKNRESELAKGKTPEARAKAREERKEKYWADDSFRSEHLEKNRERRRKEEAKVKARIQRKNWLKIPHNRISCTLRSRIRSALKYGESKCGSTEKLLGVSFGEFKIYIEALFEEGMSWDNYGKWELDHIVPCAFFDMTKEEHQKICFHYLNIQPMWARENMSKCAKITIDNLDEFLDKIKSKIYSTN